MQRRGTGRPTQFFFFQNYRFDNVGVLEESRANNIYGHASLFFFKLQITSGINCCNFFMALNFLVCDYQKAPKAGD